MCGVLADRLLTPRTNSPSRHRSLYACLHFGFGLLYEFIHFASVCVRFYTFWRGCMAISIHFGRPFHASRPRNLDPHTIAYICIVFYTFLRVLSYKHIQMYGFFTYVCMYKSYSVGVHRSQIIFVFRPRIMHAKFLSKRVSCELNFPGNRISSS